MRYAICSLILLLMPFTTSAEEVLTRSYSLPNHGIFVLKVPASWKDEITQPSSALPHTITLSATTGNQFRVMLTPVWPARPDVKPPTAEELRTAVRQMADSALLQSVEETIEVKPLKGAAHHGYYFTATDSAPLPDEFKYMNQGIIAINDLRVAFTVLTNDGQEAIVKEALSLLLSAQRR